MGRIFKVTLSRSIIVVVGANWKPPGFGSKNTILVSGNYLCSIFTGNGEKQAPYFYLYIMPLYILLP
jgi:hypothetical protein